MSPWPTSSLGEVCTFLNGGTPSRSVETYWNGTIPWITGADIDGPVVVTARSAITPDGLRSSATNLVTAGTLLLVTRTSVGKVASAGIDLCFSQDITAVIPEPSALDPGYLRHFLASCADVLKRSARGATIKGVTRADVSGLKIPLPPLAEQRRIAGILDAADGLRAKRRESINLLDSLTQSIFLDRFGDPMRNPKGLPTAPLNTLVRRITDGTHQSPEWSETGVPFLFVSNIASGRISYETEKYISEQTHATLTRRCPIELGDVLYSTVGTYGVPVVVVDPRPFAFQRHIAHIKPDPSRIDPHFLKVMLASPGVKAQADSQARGVAQKTVNLGSIQEFVVFDLPLAEQLSASEIFSAIERERERQVASLFALELLFASLQSRAFHGDL